jgi:hypothetical protein
MTTSPPGTGELGGVPVGDVVEAAVGAVAVAGTSLGVVEGVELSPPQEASRSTRIRVKTSAV